MDERNMRRLYRALVTMRDSGNVNRFNMAKWFGDLSNHYRPADGGFYRQPAVADLRPSRAQEDPAKPCGTAACLAGWCQLLGAETREERAEEVADFAKRWLGLKEGESDHLFLGRYARAGTARARAHITLDETIAELRRVILEGRVLP